MTLLLRLAPLLLAVLVPAVLIYGAVRVSRWLAYRTDPIDTLIAGNRARWRRDAATGRAMSTVDWYRVDRAGEARWQQALAAQLRTRPALLRPPAEDAADFDIHPTTPPPCRPLTH